MAWLFVVSVRLAGQVMPVVLLPSGRCVPAAADNGINGTSMPVLRHRWSIDVVAGRRREQGEGWGGDVRGRWCECGS
jgi:hypothetical protein